MKERVYNYFELVRGDRYLCNLDSKDFKGKFEYRIKNHYLAYRHIEERPNRKWRTVYNKDWYSDSTAYYKRIK